MFDLKYVGNSYRQDVNCKCVVNCPRIKKSLPCKKSGETFSCNSNSSIQIFKKKKTNFVSFSN